MTIEMPAPIAAYMDASARLDPEAMLAPFAETAVVGDERETHRGRAEIAAWIAAASIKAQAVPRPLSIRRDGDDHVVTAEVSGAFPGSPVTLDFRFTLTGDRIGALAIS